MDHQKDLSVVQRVKFLRDTCRGKRVLHLGCTNHPYTQDSIDSGMLLHDDLNAVAAELWGLDSDSGSLKLLEAHGHKNLLLGDLEDLENVGTPGDFDVIVAGEMIEHLDDPGRFLRGIRTYMGPNTKLVITTVNAYCAFRFFHYALRGRRGVSEPTHPDHVSYYSYTTLRNILGRHDLSVTSFLYYDIGVEHRKFNRRISLWLNDIAVRLAPHLADGLIAVCSIDASSHDG